MSFYHLQTRKPIVLIWLVKLYIRFKFMENLYLSKFFGIDLIFFILKFNFSYIFRMFVDAVIEWQPTAEIGSVLINASIDVIGHCKTLSLNLFNLLESTIFYYFRSSEISAENHRPTWSNVIQRFGPKIQQTDINLFIANENFLCLHLHAINELRLIQNNGDKIIFLQNIYRHLEQYKIT